MHRRARKLLLLPATAAIIALGILGWLTRPDNFKDFWTPILNTEAVVQVCIGEPRGLFRLQGPRRPALIEQLKQGLTLAPSDIEPVDSRFLYRRDAIVMAQIAAMLKSHNITYRLRADSDAPYAELRGNPLILIGGFDAQRQMDLRRSPRYTFGRETIDGVEYKYVLDRQHPNNKAWRFRYSTNSVLEPTDYAIIIKTIDSGQPVISILGATDYSTLAAGEFITTPERLNELTGPTGWQRKNVQMVVQTRVIQGVPGPTKAVAIHTW